MGKETESRNDETIKRSGEEGSSSVLLSLVQSERRAIKREGGLLQSVILATLVASRGKEAHPPF